MKKKHTHTHTSLQIAILEKASAFYGNLWEKGCIKAGDFAVPFEWDFSRWDV
jgi:hypothetical protein